MAVRSGEDRRVRNESERLCWLGTRSTQVDNDFVARYVQYVQDVLACSNRKSRST